jgi:rubrerythrin
MKFCGSCGKRRPKRLVCDKCGYELEMSALPPKFCPQCGDPIDEKDEVDD